MKFEPKTSLKNEELVLIYHYLKRNASRQDLIAGIARSGTNIYYYIGRAVVYWLKTGVLHFKRIKDTTELGGRDL